MKDSFTYVKELTSSSMIEWWLMNEMLMLLINSFERRVILKWIVVVPYYNWFILFVNNITILLISDELVNRIQHCLLLPSFSFLFSLSALWNEEYYSSPVLFVLLIHSSDYVKESNLHNLTTLPPQKIYWIQFSYQYSILEARGWRDLIPLVKRNEGFSVPSLIIHLFFFSRTIVIRNQRMLSDCLRLCWVYWWVLWWMEWRVMY